MSTFKQEKSLCAKAFLFVTALGLAALGIIGLEASLFFGLLALSMSGGLFWATQSAIANERHAKLCLDNESITIFYANRSSRKIAWTELVKVQLYENELILFLVTGEKLGGSVLFTPKQLYILGQEFSKLAPQSVALPEW